MSDQLKAKEQLDQLIDPRIMAGIKRRLLEFELREIDLPTFVYEPPLHLNPEDWMSIGPVEEASLPFQVGQLVDNPQPQALLRDLVRPLWQFEHIEFERRGERDVGGEQAMAEAKAAQEREPLTWHQSSIPDFVAAINARHVVRHTAWVLPKDSPK